MREIRELISRVRIEERIAELGRQIAEDYDGKELILVCTLKGAWIFHAALCLAIDPMRVRVIPDFLVASSYNGTESTGEVRIFKDLGMSIRGKHVLLVEDIVDTRRTVQALLSLLELREPATIGVCTLLDKKEREEIPIPLRYVGFEIPNEFVVGFGLDYDEGYRTLAFIGVLEDELS